MTGQTGLDGNFCRFEITNLAYHDNIRILAQYRPQAARKGHVDFGVDLGLANGVNELFNGVFDRHDVAAVVIDGLERGV